MKKKNIVTIGGMSCCGKSVTVQGLLKFLGPYQHYSSGDTVRELAAKANVLIENFRDHADKNNIDFDSIVDDRLRLISAEENYYLVDSRLGYHFIPNSFKVFLSVDPIVGAERRLNDLKKNNFSMYEHYTVEDVIADNKRRDDANNDRYRMLYGINYTDHSCYDLVIDTTDKPIADVVYEILIAYIKWLRTFLQ